MAGTERSDDDRDPSTAESDRHRTEDDRRAVDGAAEWIAASTLRVVLAVVGFVVLLFGLGMAMGVDLLGMVADVLNSEVGRWLLVALVGLAIIVVAVRGFAVPSD